MKNEWTLKDGRKIFLLTIPELQALPKDAKIISIMGKERLIEEADKPAPDTDTRFGFTAWGLNTTPQNNEVKIATPLCSFCGIRHWLGQNTVCSHGINPNEVIDRLTSELHQANYQIESLKQEVIEWRDDRQKVNAELSEGMSKKSEVVAELVDALKHFQDCIDLCKGHGTPIIKDRSICYLAMMETEQALSRAATI